MIQCEAAEILASTVNEDGDAGEKQSKVMEVQRAYDLAKDIFAGTLMDRGDEQDDDEDTMFDRICRAELAEFANQAAVALANSVQEGEFTSEEVEVLRTYVQRKYFTLSLEATLSKLDAENEGEEEEKKESVKEELEKSKTAEQDALQALGKTQRMKQYTERLKEMNSQKRKNDNALSDTSTEAKFPRTDRGPTGVPATMDSANSTITPMEKVFAKMIKNCTVCVKLPYVRDSFSRIPSKFHKNNNYFEIFETIVCEKDIEYPLIAKNEVAADAANRLAAYAGRVIELSPVQFSFFKKAKQLELMPNFRVVTCANPEPALQNQSLKCVQLSSVYNMKHRTRTSLKPVFLFGVGDEQKDKNGSPFRLTKIVDSNGAVSKANIWGPLASLHELWREDAYVCIYACEVNQEDERIDIRTFSSVVPAEADQTFPKPEKLDFMSYVRVET